MSNTNYFVYFAGISIDNDPDTIDYLKVGRVTYLDNLPNKLKDLTRHNQVYEIGVIPEPGTADIDAKTAFSMKFAHARIRGDWYHCTTRLLTAVKNTVVHSSELNDSATADDGTVGADESEVTKFDFTFNEAKLLVDIFDDNHNPPINIPRQIGGMIGSMEDEGEQPSERLISLLSKIEGLGWMEHSHLITRIYMYHHTDDNHIDGEEGRLTEAGLI